MADSFHSTRVRHVARKVDGAVANAGTHFTALMGDLVSLGGEVRLPSCCLVCGFTVKVALWIWGPKSALSLNVADPKFEKNVLCFLVPMPDLHSVLLPISDYSVEASVPKSLVISS